MGRCRRWWWGGMVGVALAVGGAAAPVAVAQVIVKGGGGPLECGSIGVAALDPAPGPPTNVPPGLIVSVVERSVAAPCGGPVVATFTAEVSGITSAVAFVAVTAQCLHPAGPLLGAAGAICTPGDVILLGPSPYRIPLALAAGPEARTVNVGGTLPAGEYRIAVLIQAQGGDVAVEKRTLSVVTGGAFPGASSRSDSSGPGPLEPGRAGPARGPAGRTPAAP